VVKVSKSNDVVEPMVEEVSRSPSTSKKRLIEIVAPPVEKVTKATTAKGIAKAVSELNREVIINDC